MTGFKISRPDTEGSARYHVLSGGQLAMITCAEARIPESHDYRQFDGGLMIILRRLLIIEPKDPSTNDISKIVQGIFRLIFPNVQQQPFDRGVLKGFGVAIVYHYPESDLAYAELRAVGNVGIGWIDPNSKTPINLTADCVNTHQDPRSLKLRLPEGSQVHVGPAEFMGGISLPGEAVGQIKYTAN